MEFNRLKEICGNLLHELIVTDTILEDTKIDEEIKEQNALIEFIKPYFEVVAHIHKVTDSTKEQFENFYSLEVGVNAEELVWLKENGLLQNPFEDANKTAA